MINAEKGLFKIKKTCLLLCITAALCLLCSCAFAGDTDFAMFEERFEKSCKENSEAPPKVSCIRRDKGREYDCTFGGKNSGKYMITAFEAERPRMLTQCTLYVLSCGKPDTDGVNYIFSTMLYAYRETDSETSSSIFKKLELDKASTYKKKGLMRAELNGFTVEIFVSGAGTAITVI